MNDTMTTPPGRTRRRVAGTVGLLAAGALAGGILAGTLSASADTTGSTATSGASAGSTPVRPDEKALSATDAGDGTHEAHMTKADGTPVTVKLDSSFTLIGVEDGMGKGDPAPSGQPPAGTQGSTSGSSSGGAGV